MKYRCKTFGVCKDILNTGGLITITWDEIMETYSSESSNSSIWSFIQLHIHWYLDLRVLQHTKIFKSRVSKWSKKPETNEDKLKRNNFVLNLNSIP